jgi:hypothetical protein
MKENLDTEPDININENMNILSWDVGIKNLAYCLIEKKDNKFSIKKWNVINLSDNTKMCNFVIRTGKECGKTAKFEMLNKDLKPFLCFSEKCTFYGCKDHIEKFTPIIKPLEKKIKCYNNKCSNFATKYIEGSDIYCWCDIHFEKNSPLVLKKIVKKKVFGTNCMKQSMQLTTEKLFNILDAETDFLKVKYVLIENQPSMKNPTMKTIASILFSYFIMRGIVEKNKTNSLIEEVKFISPSNKLKVNKETTDTIITKDKDCKIYKLTKKLGVKYCQSLINENDLLVLSKYKKKDDMSDAFLQGFQYLFKPVPIEYLNKLHGVGMETIK